MSARLLQISAPQFPLRQKSSTTSHLIIVLPASIGSTVTAASGITSSGIKSKSNLNSVSNERQILHGVNSPSSVGGIVSVGWIVSTTAESSSESASETCSIPLLHVKVKQKQKRKRQHIRIVNKRYRYKYFEYFENKYENRQRHLEINISNIIIFNIIGINAKINKDVSKRNRCLLFRDQNPFNNMNNSIIGKNIWYNDPFIIGKYSIPNTSKY